MRAPQSCGSAVKKQDGGLSTSRDSSQPNLNYLPFSWTKNVMPLRDLFEKAPTPLAPNNEPWPRPPSSEESVQSSKLSLRQSPLFSATTHPTLEEFLRTNYLMIPEFVAQVKRAKSFATGGIGKEGEMTLLSQSPVLNIEESSKQLNPSSVSSAAKSTSIGDVKHKKALPSGRNKDTQEEKKPASKTSHLSILAQEGSTTEVLRPQVKSRPRVRAVMKGGMMVTLPVSRPKMQISYKNADACDENSSTLPSNSGNKNSVTGVSGESKVQLR